MVVEEELKRDHADMQAVIEAKQKIIDAQVHTYTHTRTPELSNSRRWTPEFSVLVCTGLYWCDPFRRSLFVSSLISGQ